MCPGQGGLIAKETEDKSASRNIEKLNASAVTVAACVADADMEGSLAEISSDIYLEFAHLENEN